MQKQSWTIFFVILFITGCSQIPELEVVDDPTWQTEGLRLHHFEAGEGQPVEKQ